MIRDKLPNGGYVRHRPDRLMMHLEKGSQAVPVELPVPIALPPTSDFAGASSPVDYSTPDFDPNNLRGYEVTAFGIGSLGGGLQERLAAAPLTFNVVDDKKVEKKHLQFGRTVYEPAHVGLFKVEALKRRIERDHPATTVIPLPYNVREIPTIEIQSLIRKSLLVILAIDDPESILRISDLAWSQVEMIQAAAHRQARSGHIAISIPLVTPCLRCTLGIDSPQRMTRLDSESANSLDIATITLHAATIAMEVMYSKVTGRDITRWDPSKNLLYIANRREELSPDGPGLHWESSQKRSGCTICNP